jgi:outer membrane protein assembly factor BamB
VDWPTFGYGPQRSGRNPHETGLRPRAAKTLVQRWATTITSPGWAVTTQPLVAARVRTGGARRTSLVFVGTESGALAALDFASGRLVWGRQLGTSTPGPVHGCPGYPDMTFGVTGTPVLDRPRGRIYAVGGDGRAYAFRLRDGHPVAGWPVAVASPLGEHVWSALTLLGRRLHVSVASYCDRPPYVGKVVGVDVERAARFATWRVTRRRASDPWGGGIWGWGGVSIDASDGDVYAATGNALTKDENDPFAERVVRLGPNLRVKASDYPFVRRTVIDQDFGSTPVLYRPAGCPPQLTALNKDGELMVYARDGIANGPLQRLRVTTPSSEGGQTLLGLTAWDAPRRMLYVVTPTDSPDGRYRHGLLAFRVGVGCRLALAWDTPIDSPGITSAPVVAAGVVYVSTGAAREIRAFSAATGRSLRRLRVGNEVWAAPTPVNGALLAVSYDGVVHAYAPAPG